MPAGSLLGQVTDSDDSRAPLGIAVGFRLSDPEGITEPTAMISEQIHDLLLYRHDRHPDGSSTLTFELLPRTNE